MKHLLLALTFLYTMSLQASELAYVKTDTPRDTMVTFINAMNDYRQGVLEKNPKKMSRIYDAIRCFAEKDNAVVTSKREKELAAIFLKEVIDRVIVMDFQKIPENPTKNRWRLKKTEIVLKPQAQGDREGEWLITEGSWKRSGEFYQRVLDLPYLKGSGQGAAYIQPWMETYLPHWSKKETLRLKNWQWLGLLFGLFMGLFFRVLTSIFLGIYRGLKITQRISWKKEFLVKIEKPASLLVAAFFWYIWVYYLKLEGLSYSIVQWPYSNCVWYSFHMGRLYSSDRISPLFKRKS